MSRRPGQPSNRRRFTNDEVIALRKRWQLEPDLQLADLALEYEMTASSLSKLINGQTYTELPIFPRETLAEGTPRRQAAFEANVALACDYADLLAEVTGRTTVVMVRDFAVFPYAIGATETPGWKCHHTAQPRHGQKRRRSLQRLRPGPRFRRPPHRARVEPQGLPEWLRS